MLTTWPFAVLVVILIGILVLVGVASALCHQAMRTGNHFEAEIEAHRIRYSVRVHPAPPREDGSTAQRTVELPAPSPAKNNPGLVE
jgi:hypothetical protein